MLLILKLYICEIFERKRQKGASNMWKFIKCKEADGPEGKVGGGLCVCNNGEKRVCLKKLLAQACGIPVGRRSGGRLAMTLVATINVIILFLFFFFSVVYFSHRRSAQIKKLI